VNRLVDDLLDVARFTAGKLELRRAVVGIDQIVDQAVAQCRPAIEAKRHELVVQRAGADVCVDGDQVRLVQITSNLMTNAARYTPAGGRIELHAAMRGDEVVIRVADNGRGIAASVLPRIFEMFVQDRADTSGSGGLGLGLGIVKRLVELHGGSVHATSEGPGNGSTFEVRLPAVQQLPAIEPLVMPLVAARRMRALICDDADDTRELVAELLRAQGHDVTTVASGPAALESILAERPDVALIDIGLPGMDGYEVARSVRRTAPTGVRLVAVTGFGQASDRAAAFDAGFDAHLTKPATVRALLDAMSGEPAS
jgi:CheY-like chemotaxis protein